MTGHSASAAVLFVCLGNICRSPLAEAAFRAEALRLGLDIDIDSAGTGDWHVGSPPDRRAQATARRYGLDIAAYRARQVTADDFDRFTHIFALDHDNLADLRRIAPAGHGRHLSLLMDVVQGRVGTAVRDPYFGGDEGFEETWRDVAAAARALAAMLAR